MNIILVSQFFWPEQFIVNDLVRHLVRQGHTVTVLTGKPNYPSGKIFPGYTKSGLQKELYAESVEVVRVPLRPRGPGGAWDLILNFLSFAWFGVWHLDQVAAGRRCDAVLVFASPITAAIPAILLKWRTKARLALWIQDLWPESLSATGFIQNRLLLGMVGWLVRAIYGCADMLLIQSTAFRKAVERYARHDKIVYYPNSFDVSSSMTEKEPARQLGDLIRILDLNFCIVFAGNLGRAQAVETLVLAARELRDLTDCRIVLVGSGSMLDWVRDQKSSLGLDNLVLAGRFPMSVMPEVFSRAGGLLVTLKSDEIFAYTIPSKVQAYLAAGKPIIAALNGEGARVVTEAEAGLVCPAEDAAALAQCVRRLYAMSEEERARMGAAGYSYFLEHFEMRRQAERLVEILGAERAAE